MVRLIVKSGKKHHLATRLNMIASPDPNPTVPPVKEAGPALLSGVSIGQEDLCLIQNRVDPVEIAVTKEWLYSREELVVDDKATIELFCSSVFGGDGATLDNGLMYWSWLFDGSQASQMATVYPDYAGATNCWTEESFRTSAVESESTCSPPVSIGLGDPARNCIVTNTVFFEGIPTLSQYGLILISALMLLNRLDRSKTHQLIINGRFALNSL